MNYVQKAQGLNKWVRIEYTNSRIEYFECETVLEFDDLIVLKSWNYTRKIYRSEIKSYTVENID